MLRQREGAIQRPAAHAERAAWVWPLAVAVLLAGTCALRWPYLDVPISADEGGYATAAYWWARGDTLYQDITITRPQGIFVVFRLIEALGLGSVRGIHLFAMGYTALTTLALLAVVSRVWGRAVGLGAAALFTVVMATPFLEGYSANAELFMLLPLLLGLWAQLRADDYRLGGRPGLWLLAAAGALGALALLIKPSGVSALPLAALWVARRWRTEGAPRGAWLRAEVALGLGFAAGLAPAIAHGLLTAPDRYLDAVLLYRLGRDSLVGGATDHQLHFLGLNSLYILVRLPVFLLAPLGWWAVSRGGDKGGRDLLWLWTLTSIAGTALGGNWFLHYYQQLLPAFAVATVLGARTLLRRLAHPAWFAAQCAAAGCVVLLGLVLAPILARGPDLPALPGWEPVVPAVAPVAAYLREHSAPDETIYVIYDHADIYYFARRRPAARWLHYRELAWTPGAFDEQVARLADPATAPRYIVGAQEVNRWGFDADGALRAVVERDYTREETLGGVPLYRRLERPASLAESERRPWPNP